jgi:hypothetical protein
MDPKSSEFQGSEGLWLQVVDAPHSSQGWPPGFIVGPAPITIETDLQGSVWIDAILENQDPELRLQVAMGQLDRRP